MARSSFKWFLIAFQGLFVARLRFEAGADLLREIFFQGGIATDGIPVFENHRRPKISIALVELTGDGKNIVIFGDRCDPMFGQRLPLHENFGHAAISAAGLRLM